MKYINPCFIESLLEDYCQWCDSLRNFFVSSAKFTSTEQCFWDFIKDNMLSIVKMNQQEMNAFIAEINRLYPLVYYAKDEVDSIDLKHGRHSVAYQNKIYGKINTILAHSGCSSSISFNPSIKRMKDDANNIIKTNFRHEYVFNEIKRLFNYKKFQCEWSSRFIDSSGVEACPYCDRAFITSFHNKKNAYTADIDHFYPRSQYPFFGLSLYNLIPSCPVCNERCKLSKDFFKIKHLYPYSKNDDNAFAFIIKEEPSNLDFSEKDSFSIEIIPVSDAAKASIETFHLKGLYQSHKQTVVNIAKIKRINTPFLRHELKRLIADNDDLSIQCLLEELCLPSKANGILNKFIKDVSADLDKKMGLS